MYILNMHYKSVDTFTLQFAVTSQIRHHGFDPASSLIQVAPREGESCLRTDDIVDLISREGDSIALVLFSGVQYYTGQFFELGRIAAAAQNAGCKFGVDLAHAVCLVVM